MTLTIKRTTPLRISIAMPAHRKPRRSTRPRRLLVEMLETRAMLSASPLHLDDDFSRWDARVMMFVSERSAEFDQRNNARGEAHDRSFGHRSWESKMWRDDDSQYFSMRDRDDDWRRGEFESRDWDHAERSTWMPVFTDQPRVTIVVVDSLFTPLGNSAVSQWPEAEVFRPMASGNGIEGVVDRPDDSLPLGVGLSTSPPSVSPPAASVRPSTSTSRLAPSSAIAAVDLTWLDQPSSDDDDESSTDERNSATRVEALDDSFGDDLNDASSDSNSTPSAKRQRREKRSLGGEEEQPLALDQWLDASDDSPSDLLAHDRLAAAKFPKRGWVTIEQHASRDGRDESVRPHSRTEPAAEQDQRNSALMEAVWRELRFARNESFGDPLLPTPQALAEQLRQQLASRDAGGNTARGYTAGGMIELVAGGELATRGASTPADSPNSFVSQDVRLRGEAAMFRAFELSTPPERSAAASHQPTPPAGPQTAKLDGLREQAEL